MSGFVSLPSAADQPAPQPIPGDGFFPDVDLAALREGVRIDPTVTPVRLRDSALAAVLGIGQELAAWRKGQELAGIAKLEDVPNPRGPDKFGDLAWSTSLYLRAVASLTAADLADRVRDAGTTLAGHDRADELEGVAEVHRRNYRWAVNDLIGRPRSIIEAL